MDRRNGGGGGRALLVTGYLIPYLTLHTGWPGGVGGGGGGRRGEGSTGYWVLDTVPDTAYRVDRRSRGEGMALLVTGYLTCT